MALFSAIDNTISLNLLAWNLSTAVSGGWASWPTEFPSDISSSVDVFVLKHTLSFPSAPLDAQLVAPEM
jgi:hypothetical protein